MQDWGLREFVDSGNELLSYAVGLGVLLAVLALLMIAGRMIQANFTGDPWIAARGMGELPWVLLGICLLIASGTLAATLLQGSIHDVDTELGGLIEELRDEQQRNEAEALTNDGCLPLDNGPTEGVAVCPEDDEWEDHVNTIPVQGVRDPRCTVHANYNNCYEFCEDEGDSDIGVPNANCLTNRGEDSWIWAQYDCPNLITRAQRESTGKCDGYSGDPPSGLSDDELNEILDDTTAYRCYFYPGWVRAIQDDFDEYCEGRRTR